MQAIEQTLDSREVAEMVEKEHGKLLKDIRRYSEQFNEAKIGLVDFFNESTYVDAKGETRPCYRITKKGCEFIAHKLTGTKGTIFTARYINRFHEMETTIKTGVTAGARKVTFLQEIKAAEYIVKEMDRTQKIAFYRDIYERHGLHLDIPPGLTMEYKEDPCCNNYRKESINIIRKIHDKSRLVKIYSFSRRMLEFDQNRCL